MREREKLAKKAIIAQGIVGVCVRDRESVCVGVSTR